MAASVVWGLDIGNFAVKAVKMMKVGNACKVIDFDIVDIPGGDDEKDRVSRLQVAFGGLNKNHKFGNDPVCIAVTGNICLSREFLLPAGSDDNLNKLNDLVQYEAKQQIPFPLEQVEWGYEKYEDATGIGIVLIAVRKNDIQDLLTLTDTFKMNVTTITTSSIALFNFIHYEFKPEDTTLILDAGARGTDFVVMNKRQVYSRTIQIAGREITRVLENKFKVPYEKAEEIKKNIAQSPQMDKILAVLEPTLRQLGVEVQRTIGFYKSKARGQRIAKCYLLGHTFRLPKMAEFLQAQVREAPFAIVEGLQRLKLDDTCNADAWDREFPTMPVAMGLGLQELGLGELKLNLLPKERKVASKNLKSRIWVIASAAVVLLALGLTYYQAQNELNELTAQSEEVLNTETAATQYQNEEQKFHKMLAPQKELLQRLARVGHDRGKINRILTTLINLRLANNKPFFGTERKIYLANLYISRMPPQELLQDKEDVYRQNDFAGNEFLTKDKDKDLYGPWLKTKDQWSRPPEVRPEPPLVVIASCEVEDPKRLLVVEEEMETALKKIPEFSKDAFKTPAGSYKPAYTDAPFIYDWFGNLMSAPHPGSVPPGFDGVRDRTGRAQPANEKTEHYATFHAIFRWDEQADRSEVAESAADTETAKAPAKK